MFAARKRLVSFDATDVLPVLPVESRHSEFHP